MADIIYEIQKLQKERELFFTRSIEAENKKRKLEKQVQCQKEENEILATRVLELEEQLSFEHLLRVDIEDEMNRMESELIENNTKMESYKKDYRSLRMELNKLKEEKKKYTIEFSEISTLKMELEEQNRLLKAEIADYKIRKQRLVKKTGSGLRMVKLPYVHTESTEIVENKKRDIDKLINKLDKLEEIILNNGGRNVYNISIAKADQLVGVPESGSQIIHTNNK